MNLLFEMLFHAWCMPYTSWKTLPSLNNDSPWAYGAYTFETGFKLGMQLAVCSLDPDMLAESDIQSEND